MFAIMGLNDTAWENLFDKYHILSEIERNGQFIISANQIKEFREPRLMTKFDHKVNLPAIFAANNLSILPITRGDYIISSFSAYKEFDEPNTEANLWTWASMRSWPRPRRSWTAAPSMRTCPPTSSPFITTSGPSWASDPALQL